MDAQIVSDSAALWHLAVDLLARASLGELHDIQPLEGGANNRVFRVEAAGGQGLLKVYFHHPSDPRDRLRAEYEFVRFAWEHGIQVVPRPLTQDPGRGAALYEFIQGRPLVSAEVDSESVAAAVAFYRELNRWRQSPEAQRLPEASEACFSLEDHLGCVDRRVGRLLQVEERNPAHQAAATFVRDELFPAWDEVERRVRQESGRLGVSASAPIPSEDRRLSPSDFGFHNALRTAAGTHRFLDFEYAGWDDPAKLICDFFCQPALPVPATCWDAFTTGVLTEHAAPDFQRQRAALLLPAYRIKWCCIMLNEFLPVSRARRHFACDGELETPRLAAQLDKARQVLEVVEDAE